MNRYYFTILFFMFAALPFAQGTNVSIEPLKSQRMMSGNLPMITFLLFSYLSVM